LLFFLHSTPPAGAREYSRRHFLSEQTLDMLADMRWQYATMLADIGFVEGKPLLGEAREATHPSHSCHPACSAC
jgi:hypothetical protein